MTTIDVTVAPLERIAAAIEPGKVRGGMTSEEVADIAIRYGRDLLRLATLQKYADGLQGQLSTALDAEIHLQARVAELEALLVRACVNGGCGSILKEAGIA